MTARVAALALAIAGLIAAGVLVVRSRDDHKPSARSTTSSTATPTDAVPPVVRDVEAFVEKTRGLQFKRPVPVTLLSGNEFEARLFDQEDENKQQIELAQRALRAVRLIDRNVDLEATYKRFVGGAVVGFYDPKRHDLVVRGGEFGPYARTVLAHELTHALDDQWFGIDRPELDKPGNDEAASAFQALTEGNAVRVQTTYASQLSAADRRTAAQEEAKAATSIDTTGVPDVVQEIVSWPYIAGPKFIAAVLKAGGERKVDDAFRDPPRTTAEIEDPASYLQHRASATVALPKAEGAVLDSGIFGWESLMQTLEPVVGTDEATRAADGWAGDAYVMWDAGSGNTCIRATFVMRTPSDLGQLTSALQAWAGDRKATVEPGPSNVTLTSCG